MYKSYQEEELTQTMGFDNLSHGFRDVEGLRHFIEKTKRNGISFLISEVQYNQSK